MSQAAAPATASLREKLVLAMSTIGPVGKRGHNQKQGYDFVKATDVANEVRDALTDVGVFMTFDVESERTWEKATASGGVLFFVSLVVRYTFHDKDSNETITGRSIGWGSDSLDKAPYKAFTGAMKYALRGNFLIPDENDPENDDHGQQVVSEKHNVGSNGRPPQQQQRPPQQSDSSKAQQQARPGEQNRGHGNEGNFKQTVNDASKVGQATRAQAAAKAREKRDDSEKVRSHGKQTIDTRVAKIEWRESKPQGDKPAKTYATVHLSTGEKLFAWDVAMFDWIEKSIGKDVSLCVDDVTAQYPKILDIAYFDGAPVWNLKLVDENGGGY